MNNEIPSESNIKEAHRRIAKYIHNTPLLSCEGINKIAGSKILLKCENLQKVGAFKMRGATNAVLSLNKGQLLNGVATHSSGNHAAALSLAAKLQIIPAYIVMPKTAPEIKKKAVENYGGIITYCEPTQQDREDTLKRIVDKTNAAFIHPYDNYTIIAGQATCALEVFEEVYDLDYFITPVGGGGLLSGSCLSAKYFSPNTKVIGAEPSGADDAFRSIRDKKIYPSVNPNSIADGLLTSFSERTFSIVKKYVNQIMLADDPEIIAAMRLVWERMKLVIEPSAAVTLAVIIKNRDFFSNKTVCCILSGGNIDLNKLPW